VASVLYDVAGTVVSGTDCYGVVPILQVCQVMGTRVFEGMEDYPRKHSSNDIAYCIIKNYDLHHKFLTNIALTGYTFMIEGK